MFPENKKGIKSSIYRFYIIYFIAFGLAACGGGGGSSGGGDSAVAASSAAVSAPALPDNNATTLNCPESSAFSASSPPELRAGAISGRVTFDRVPFSAQLGSGLDYSARQEQPARGVVVEALASSDGVHCNGDVVATTLTDGDGWYRLTPSGAAKVCVRVRAQMYRAADNTSAANWNLAVADNTAANALYVIGETQAAAVETRPRRDLHAASGWANGGYSGARLAAPFAILDTACTAMNAVLAQRATTRFGALTFFWSIRNTSDDNGTLEQGKIGGAFFDSRAVAIYLRGDAAVNTDEFDGMVIAHEFAHFVTHTLSRSDSVGGDHSLFDYQDPRLAFDEGWATAFAGLALRDPFYRDSDEVATTNSPAREFYFDIRQRFSSPSIPVGWFSESSIQRALYALGSAVDDGGIGMGLGALLQTFAGGYKQTDALASIFSYGELLQREQPAFANAIAAVLDAEQINGYAISAFAENETNAPSGLDLPVYQQLDNFGNELTVCSSDAYGTQNMLSNRRYLRFIPQQAASYRFYVQPNSGVGVAGVELIDRGSTLLYQEATTAGVKLTANTRSALQSGRSYVLSVFHVGNTAPDSTFGSGDKCFQVWAEKL